MSSDGIVSFTDGETVFQIKDDGTELFVGNLAEYGALYFVLRLFVWLLFVVTSIALLFIAVNIYVWLFKTVDSAQAKYFFVIVISTALTSVIVASSIFNTSLKAEAQEKEFHLTQMALAVSRSSGVTFGSNFEKLKLLSDYGSSAHKDIRSALDPICESAYEQGEYLYYVLYRIVDDMVYAVADYENTVGVIHPIAPCPDQWLDIFKGEESHFLKSILT